MSTSALSRGTLTRMDATRASDLFDPATWAAPRANDVAREAACAALVDGLNDPREAWEALSTHGRIPVAAVDDPTRRFEPERATRRRGVEVWDPVTKKVVPMHLAPDLRSHPPTVATCVRLAASWADVLRVEALAGDGGARLRRWAPQPASRVLPDALWTTGGPPKPTLSTLAALRDKLAKAAPRTAARAGDRVRRLLADARLADARRYATPLLLGHALLCEAPASEPEAQALRSCLAAGADASCGDSDPFEPCLRAYAACGWFISLQRSSALLATSDAAKLWEDPGADWIARSPPWNDVSSRPRMRRR